MEAATIGLITTGALGALGIAGTFLAPNWTQQRAERRKASRDFRQSKRLIGAEIDALGATLDLFLESLLRDDDEGRAGGLDYITQAGRLDLPTWDEHKVVLAASLPDDAWKAVLGFYEQTVSFGHLVRSQGAHMLAAGPPPADVERVFKKHAARARAAAEILEAAEPL
jgi:hypothetical protein